MHAKCKVQGAMCEVQRQLGWETASILLFILEGFDPCQVHLEHSGPFCCEQQLQEKLLSGEDLCYEQQQQLHQAQMAAAKIYQAEKIYADSAS